MKRIMLLFLAVLLIAGCVNLPWGAPRDELEMVPQAANALIIFRPSSTLNDSDFASLYNSSEQMSFEISRIAATTGIDPAKIDRMVLFFNFDSFTQESETYGGFVASGVIEKENILEKMKLNNIITELKYGSSTIYEITSRELPENKTYLSFLGGMLVGGSRKAVEDSIDLSNGKGVSVKSRKNLMKAYDELGKDSVFLFLMESTPQMRKEINETQQQLFSIRPLSRMQSVGFSIEKKGKAVDLKLLTLADDAASAADISDLFNSSVSIGKTLAGEGSAARDVLSKIRVRANGNEVSVLLSSDMDELGKLNDELSQMASPE
ncbi:MAG: hypothetical protein Sv326_0633 [Candidatus Fermentimicrarchaeum limneticum]|uniref:Uncharacterized protein n=1 Tax=Fermentimicrarchaeum limneticum TaxID=2795018 RepID=A0A7D5XLN2_FERL1|nr:MAG: hypothetical protein Sv326_0633 [Candidatus Fermentimicrarchaeum limneticum]